MKTIKQIESEIEAAKAELRDMRKAELKGQNAISAKIKTMRLAKNYLEFKQATIENINSQLSVVNKNLQINEDRFQKYKELNFKIKVDREMYYKAYDIDKKELAKWGSELKFLSYLLT